LNWNKYYTKKYKDSSGIDLDSRLRAVGKTLLGEVIDNSQFYIFRENILKLISGSRYSRIIDVGCGTGICLEIFAEKKCANSFIGVDLNPSFVTFCESFFKIKMFVDYQFRIGSLNAIKDFEIKDSCIFMYEVVQHIDPSDLLNMLIRAKEFGVKRFVVGGVPDIDKRDLFFSNRKYRPRLVDHSDDVIGNWYSKKYFEDLRDFGQLAILSQNELYTSGYRFDVVFDFED